MRDTEMLREDNALRAFTRTWRAEQYKLHDALSRDARGDDTAQSRHVHASAPPSDDHGNPESQFG